MLIQIDITADEAEEILIALYHRSRQRRREYRANEDLGSNLASVFELKFGWVPNIWQRLHKDNVSVIVK